MPADPSSSHASRSGAIDERFAGQRCLVTGGLGFIGSNVVHRLLCAGADVIVVDALVPEHGGVRTNVPDDVDVVVASIGAPELTDTLEGVDVVFNVAGQVSHRESMLDPMRDLELNVTSHLRFLERIRAVAPEAVIVQTSTRQVYGKPLYLPVDELHPTNPIDVNGVDKLACEQFHLVYAKVHGLRASALRLTNVYGPRQHLGREGLGFLPVFVRRALGGEEIELFGDGSQLRDCLHVDDIVDALLLGASTPAAYGEVFNLGHTDVLPLSEIARLTIAAARSASTARCVPWPDELERIDIGSFQGDFSKAHRILGWSPTISFADGIASTIAWYQDRS
jgi:nucleoside-diphosphate-sugar epimerase